jgi:hypothetical protein
VLVEIGSRIPVNLLDRLFSSFAGYGLALLLGWGERKAGKRRNAGHINRKGGKSLDEQIRE